MARRKRSQPYCHSLPHVARAGYRVRPISIGRTIPHANASKPGPLLCPPSLAAASVMWLLLAVICAHGDSRRALAPTLLQLHADFRPTSAAALRYAWPLGWPRSLSVGLGGRSACIPLLVLHASAPLRLHSLFPYSRELADTVTESREKHRRLKRHARRSEYSLALAGDECSKNATANRQPPTAHAHET